MAPDGIFLINGDLESGDAQLFEMIEQPYDSEDVLQELLQRYPNLLAGGQIDPDVPRRWLLVRREQPVSDAAAASKRWSLDHLFVDQDGIPTLVEVKRATDTRIRREVVGQMMDYAANGVAYWPVEQIRAEFEARHPDPDEAVRLALGADIDPTELWTKVGENLASGKVRLLFVADEIPRELKRIVEFLNEQMKAEVMAVGLRQYRAVGTDSRTMVATVYGSTERGRDQKQSRPGDTRLWNQNPQWDEGRFFETFGERDPVSVAIAKRVVDWASRSSQIKLDWGRGAKVGTVHFYVTLPSRSLFLLQTDARLYIHFGNLAKEAAFGSTARRVELARRLEEIPGIRLLGKTDNNYPPVALAVLDDPGSFESFTATMEWAAEQILSAAS